MHRSPCPRSVLALLAACAVACSSSRPPPVDPGDSPGSPRTPPITGGGGGGGGTSGPCTPEPTTAARPYPPEPFGTDVGQSYPRLAFKGHRDGSLEWVDVDLADYYDPDGKRGVNAVLVVLAAAWCAQCKNEAKYLPGVYESKYKKMGARFLAAMFENEERRSASDKTVDAWLSAYSINYDIVLDKCFSTMPRKPGRISLPFAYLIDPRSMKVVRLLEGAETSVPGLDELLAKNGAR